MRRYGKGYQGLRKFLALIDYPLPKTEKNYHKINLNDERCSWRSSSDTDTRERCDCRNWRFSWWNMAASTFQFTCVEICYPLSSPSCLPNIYPYIYNAYKNNLYVFDLQLYLHEKILWTKLIIVLEYCPLDILRFRHKNRGRYFVYS